MLRLQPDAFQQPADPLTSGIALQQPMHAQRFHNRIAHRLPWVEGGVGVLKDKLDIAAQRLKLTARQRINPLAVEGDAAALSFHQPQQRPAGR